MDESEISQVFESIGFQKNEILIYLDLIRTGGSSAHEVSKRTKIHRSNVYDTLNKMIKKGIVIQSVEKKVKKFHPISPKNLLNYVKQKEYDLQKIIPEIEKIQGKPPPKKRRIAMSEGIRSFRIILNNLLEKNQEILVYGIPKGVSDIVGGFINEFHKKRVKKKIKMFHIYNKDAKKRIKYLNSMEYTEAKYLPSIFNTNIMTMICGDVVLLTFWDDPIFTIVIENKAIADTYKNYFNIFWNEAKISL